MDAAMEAGEGGTTKPETGLRRPFKACDAEEWVVHGRSMSMAEEKPDGGRKSFDGGRRWRWRWPMEVEVERGGGQQQSASSKHSKRSKGMAPRCRQSVSVTLPGLSQSAQPKWGATIDRCRAVIDTRPCASSSVISMGIISVSP
ncbi:hypothetical protein ANO11243_003920 [Dothideomycetidae sp. 11243]|nr:hypothetical protein ANO11243_003920 [fungal sp. No.11243]